jgi:hypothetical protein
MAPVENVCLLGRVVPLDERLAAFGRLKSQSISTARRRGHDVGLSCKGRTYTGSSVIGAHATMS